jgi:hypothetical protein
MMGQLGVDEKVVGKQLVVDKSALLSLLDK